MPTTNTHPVDDILAGLIPHLKDTAQLLKITLSQQDILEKKKNSIHFFISSLCNLEEIQSTVRLEADYIVTQEN